MIETFNHLRLSGPEILSLIGLVQCVYILVYIAFRAGGWRHAIIPFVYFLVLGAAFFSDFASRRFEGHYSWIMLAEWTLWAAGPPVAVLLMIQIARISEPPPRRSLWLLLLVPAAFILALAAARMVNKCTDFLSSCASFGDWLTLAGFLAGVISLFAMWSQRPLLIHLSTQAAGRERYWLIFALVVANLFFLGTMLLSLTPALADADAAMIRTIWGLGFVYLAGTSLFRIYPQAIRLVERGNRGLSDEDRKLVERIENLLNLEKVYLEPTYNRVNLAQELGVSETIVSRIINLHFGKSLPQLFNELRVADARRLLEETDAPVKTIAEEVGFNSIASFNRVFKEIANQSPGQFREEQKSRKSG